VPLTRMEHFLVLTDDVDRTRDFYCDALGIVPTENHLPSFDISQLFLLDPNGIKIEINISTSAVS
jgi:catechol 2,3-dioxygenase-like lactoylglutathione lyase family enzyme